MPRSRVQVASQLAGRSAASRSSACCRPRTWPTCTRRISSSRGLLGQRDRLGRRRRRLRAAAGGNASCCSHSRPRWRSSVAISSDSITGLPTKAWQPLAAQPVALVLEHVGRDDDDRHVAKARGAHAARRSPSRPCRPSLRSSRMAEGSSLAQAVQAFGAARSLAHLEAQRQRACRRASGAAPAGRPPPAACGARRCSPTRVAAVRRPCWPAGRGRPPRAGTPAR